MEFFWLVVIIGFIWLSIVGANEREKQMTQTRNREQDFVTRAQSELSAQIKEHLPALALKHKQTLTKDEYGVVDISRWAAEVDYFIDKVLWRDPMLASYLGGIDSVDPKESIDGLSKRGNELNEKGGSKGEVAIIINKMGKAKEKCEARMRENRELINNLVFEYREQEIESGAPTSVDIDSLDPVQFEHYCADLLNSSGWNARVTQASGDQGIDVIAMYGNVKAVLQCKKYSQPVGNAAVQEVIAGKAFEQAHVAAVVSNATYTPSAKQLASTTGVHLLHFSGLQQFAERLGLVEESQPVQEAMKPEKTKSSKEEVTDNHVLMVRNTPKPTIPNLVAKKEG